MKPSRTVVVQIIADSLKLIKPWKERTTTIYVYRAVAPGHHTLVLTPRDPGPDGA
jgi:hypothetical protein